MYQVEGYAFETKEQEHTAKHEVEIIGYIRKNTRMDDPDIVLALYNKLVLKEIFVTPVGYDFLHRLQEYLYTIPYIRREDILPITVYEPEGMVSKEKSEHFHLCDLMYTDRCCPISAVLYCTEFF